MKWQWFSRPRALIDLEDFDTATRGPWGALSLMMKRRKQYVIPVRFHVTKSNRLSSYLASMGAFITVVSLAIDPFSQQIVHYYTCFESIPSSTTSLPRTNNYTRGGLSSKIGYAELDNQMAAAMYMATIDPPDNPSSIVPVLCTTGNCTFPATDNATLSTLGMCYSTMDITSHVQKNVSSGYDFGYWLPDLTWGHLANDTEHAEATVGIADASKVWHGSQSAITINNSHYTMMSPKKALANSPGFAPDFDDLFTFDTLMLKVNASECDIMNPNIHFTANCTKHPWAFRTSLYPCIKTFSSSVTNNILNELVLSTIPLKKTNYSAIEITTSVNLTYSLATDKILVNGAWKTCQILDYYTDVTPVPISINGTLQLFRDQPTKWYPVECVWMLDYIPALALNQFLSWMYDESPLLAVESNTVINSGSLWLKPLYRNGTANIDTVNNYMENLVSGMTGIMRQRGDSVQGIALMTQTCIHVYWTWLLLPAGLVISSILLLAATMRACKSTDMWNFTGSWKSSSLALLFHGLDNDVRDRIGDVVRKSEMEDLSKRLPVKIAKTARGLRFVDRADALDISLCTT